MEGWSQRSAAWTPPEGWAHVRVVDAHTAGEPLRVILDGFPRPAGATLSRRRLDAATRYDALRRALMWEPRGHADMYGCLVVPPVSPEADFGVLFMHNEGFSTMCGHGIIGVVTVVLELGLLARPAGEEVPVGIDTPAGFVQARARVEDGRVRSVSFVNVPSYVAAHDLEVDVPGVGRVRYDVAFGGAFYAFVEAEGVGLRLVPGEVGRLIEMGRAIKRAAAEAGEPIHPNDPALGFLYGTIFVGPGVAPGAHSRNVCVFADGEVDRSPTGTGVSARLALHHARGELAVGEEIRIESILGTSFTGKVLRETAFGPHAAVVPEVAGSAFVTGRGEILVAPDDPLAEGFLLR